MAKARTFKRKPKNAGNFCIDRDGFDIRSFKLLRERTSTLDGACKNGDAFAQDIYSSLYKWTPNRNENNPAHAPMVDQMLQLPEWQQFRATTRLNEVASALGTVELHTKLAAEVEEEQKAREEFVGPLQPGESAQGNDDLLRNAARQAIREAQKSVEDKMDAASALQGTGEGVETQRNPADILAIHEKLSKSDKLMAIARMAGRMRRIAARKHAERVRHGADEVVDVEMGRDLSRTLVTELALLDDNGGELEFLRKFAEGQLLQYRLEGQTPKGRGPIVLCLDESGSMSGDKEVWSKAMALGIMTVAAKERRKFTLIAYADANRIRRHDFPEKAPPTAELIKALESFLSGGTDFNRPIGEALDTIQSAEFRKADIVFVTDGEATVSDATHKRLETERKTNGTKFYSICIGQNAKVLEPISDAITFVGNLSKDAEALEIAFGV